MVGHLRQTTQKTRVRIAVMQCRTLINAGLCETKVQIIDI